MQCFLSNKKNRFQEIDLIDFSDSISHPSTPSTSKVQLQKRAHDGNQNRLKRLTVLGDYSI